MSLLPVRMYSREWTVLRNVLAVKLSCGFLDSGVSGFSGSGQGIIAVIQVPACMLVGWSYEMGVSLLTGCGNKNVRTFF